MVNASFGVVNGKGETFDTGGFGTEHISHKLIGGNIQYKGNGHIEDPEDGEVVGRTFTIETLKNKRRRVIGNGNIKGRPIINVENRH